MGMFNFAKHAAVFGIAASSMLSPVADKAQAQDTPPKVGNWGRLVNEEMVVGGKKVSIKLHACLNQGTAGYKACKNANTAYMAEQGGERYTGQITKDGYLAKNVCARDKEVMAKRNDKLFGGLLKNRTQKCSR